mgnify:CR=1 FL=1
MQCYQCSSAAVMPRSGICLSCGHLNQAVKVEAEEKLKTQQQAEQEREKQLREETLIRIASVINLAEQGEIKQANQILQAVITEDPELNIAKRRAEAELWRIQKLPEMQLAILEKLQSQLAFNQANLDYYYQLACLLQQLDSPGKAYYIFNQFIESSLHLYKDDIIDRWRQLKEQGITAESSHGLVSGHILRVISMDKSDASLRGLIDEISRKQQYFRDSVLLNQQDYQDLEKIEHAYSGELVLKDLVKAIQRTLELEDFGLSIKVETQDMSLFQNKGQSQTMPLTLITLKPIKDRALCFDEGSIYLGVQVLFEGKTGVNLGFYEYFTPQKPEDLPGQQADARDFNDALYTVLTSIQHTSDQRRKSRLQTLKELLQRTVKSELEKRGRSQTAQFF